MYSRFYTRIYNSHILLIIIVFAFILSGCHENKIKTTAPVFRDVYLDDLGVIRWRDNNEEVALFGANYNLPSACDYRAAGYITDDRKKLIDQDMAHFARMGWNGMRLALWGDWENSDSLGNLVINEHLDLLDYLIFKARDRGIYMLFTPMHVYSPMFPEQITDTTANGFSKYFRKDELGTNPDAIDAQVNYLKQILNHINPYTKNALKDEPSILFIEMINEPHHHSENTEVSIGYINSLVRAVRSTGCNKILFHNYSQDFRIGSALKGSEIEGASFGWYPSGLVSGRTLTGNYLRTVDEYPSMLNSEISNMPRIVYEFDIPDMYNGYMYPAIARTFRSVGTQFAAMFSYDMIITAPYNLGWQTHFLNMVYSPCKAVSTIIAAEVMKNIPMWQTYGNYPDNTSFGPFRVSYEENLSEMVTNDKFFYSNNTITQPPNPDSLKRIIGYGSSPVVRYEGKGIYFLDKINKNIWRLEVYPDAIIVNDPFAMHSPDKIVSRLIYREWPMNVNLHDLGNNFHVHAINKGNVFKTTVTNKEFKIFPGIYILSKDKDPDTSMPEYIGYVGMDEFICNEPEALPLQVKLTAFDEYLADQPVEITADIIDNSAPDEVIMYIWDISNKYSSFKSFPMKHTSGYTYKAYIESGTLQEGYKEFAVTVKKNGSDITFPSGTEGNPVSWGFTGNKFWKTRIVRAETPLPLLVPEKDAKRLEFTRIGDHIRFGIYDLIPTSLNGEGIIRLYFPIKVDAALDDYTMSLTIKGKVDSRKAVIQSANSLKMKVRACKNSPEAFITLVEADGTSWSKKIHLSTKWTDVVIPFNQLGIGKGIKLPQGFPERWNYWIKPAEGRGEPGDKLQIEKAERLQISLRPSGDAVAHENPWIEFGSVILLFE